MNPSGPGSDADVGTGRDLAAGGAAPLLAWAPAAKNLVKRGAVTNSRPRDDAQSSSFLS
jgi:hypothetical protein